MKTITENELFTTFNSSITVLTPNRRLSATLHKRYQQYQQNLQQNTWLTPDILPLLSWLERSWQQYTCQYICQHPHLLTTAQELYIWETILGNTKESQQLLQLSETANLARSAWSLLKQWQVEISQLNQIEEQSKAFHQWMIQFNKTCLDKGLIESAQLADILRKKIVAKEFIPTKQIILVGFAEITPQLEQLFSACKKVGSEIKELKSTVIKANNCQRIALVDEENELRVMAKWVKKIFKNQPENTKIGCVIPNLERNRDRVSQIFSEEFAPENCYTIDSQQAPFNISAGKSFAEYPLIHIALQLLMLSKKNISKDHFSEILFSPFLGDAEFEYTKRANFDALLRRANVNSLNILSLLKEVKTYNIIEYCPKLAERLQNYFALLPENKKLHSFHEWANIFSQLLTTLGWPGERSLNSSEYQTVETWLKLLTELIDFDQITGAVTFQQALYSLQKLAAQHIFQPKSPDTPIQVLGLLEAAGLPFDYLWIAGMDDLSIPPQPQPNPLLPKRLQRELNMPHATAERELKYCQDLLEQYKQNCPHIIFSYAEKNDELALQSSPLIRQYPLISMDDLLLEKSHLLSERIYQTKKIESIVDDFGPEILANEKMAGGINVIKQQALCPFKAFAEWRLHAQPLENPLPGLRSKDRGTIIHKALEIFWHTIRDHHSLTNTPEDEINKILNDSIDHALQVFKYLPLSSPQYLQLERKRLFKLIKDWLAIEKNRDPFKVITQEINVQIQLNKLHLNVRIDRIDELDDGNKLIIDYKTGKNNDLNQLFSDRPEEPQLALYALLEPEKTIGISFAQITAGENCFKGISKYALDIKGIKLISEFKNATAKSWDEQVTQWNTVLTQLSNDFCQGIAKVNPKQAEQTCTWCSLKSFCRINENLTLDNHS